MHAAGTAASASSSCAGTDADHATLLSNRSGFKTASGTCDRFGDTCISASYIERIGDGVDWQASGGAGDGYLRLRWSDPAALLPHRSGWRMKTNE